MTDPAPPEKARTLEQIRRLCKPKPLEGEMLRYFVETDEARDPRQNTRGLILDALEAGEDVHVLLYGHRGCGKSTELNKLLDENRDAFIPVTFDVQKEIPPASLLAEDLILVIVERVFSVLTKEEKLSLDSQTLQKVHEYFAETTEIEKETREAALAAGAGMDMGESVAGKLLGFFAKFRADIQAGTRSETTSVVKLRQRPAELLDQANLVFESARKALRQAGRHLLVVVEGLDKVSISQARGVFVENVNLLTGLRTNVIYTIPIWLFHSPDAGVFKHHFDETVAQPMIKVVEPGAGRAAGHEVVRRVVLSRIAAEAIDDAAVDLLIQKTGGVLRDAFQVLKTAAGTRDASLPLRSDHVRYGLDKVRAELARQVTLPMDGRDWGPLSVSDLFDRLGDYARKHRSGKKIPVVSDPVNQILLQSGALVEYDGQGWLGVHPLLLEHLQEMGEVS